MKHLKFHKFSVNKLYVLIFLILKIVKLLFVCNSMRYLMVHAVNPIIISGSLFDTNYLKARDATDITKIISYTGTRNHIIFYILRSTLERSCFRLLAALS